MLNSKQLLKILEEDGWHIVRALYKLQAVITI